MRTKYEPRTDGTKGCRLCRLDLPRIQFGICRNNADGRLGVCHDCERTRRSLAKHGMTREEKAAQAKQQGGCLICHRTAPGDKGWVMDHDRSCCPGDRSCERCRRGVLCQWCNNALGYAMDSPGLLRSMADYLDAHAARICATHQRGAYASR